MLQGFAQHCRHPHCRLVSLRAFLLPCIPATSNCNQGQPVLYKKYLFLKFMSEARHSHSAAAARGCLEGQDCTSPVSQIWMYSTSAEADCLLQEALRTQKEPSTVLNSRIWKMAGQVLMDNPDCPVEVSRAVHALMGISLLEVPVGSPVSQANSRQARTAHALQGVSLAAQESLAGMTASRQ